MLSNPLIHFDEEQQLQRSLPVITEGKCFVQKICMSWEHASLIR